MNAGGIAGGFFDFFGAIGKHQLTESLAKEQEDRAKKLKAEASQVKAPALREEFRNVERMKALGAISGLPGMKAAGEEIEQSGATALRGGKEALSSGGEYLQLASNMYAAENKAKRDLKLQDAQFRSGAMGDYANAVWNIGNEQLKNDAIKRAEQQELHKQASALENASTANKYQGRIDAIEGLTESMGSMVGGFSGGMGGGGGKSPSTPLAMPSYSEASGNPTQITQQPAANLSTANTVPVTGGAQSSLSAMSSLSDTDMMMIQNYMKQGKSFQEALELLQQNRYMH